MRWRFDSAHPLHKADAARRFMAMKRCEASASRPNHDFMFYTYVLQSLKDKKMYIGYSANLKNRIKQHLSGLVLSTKGRLPIRLIFYEAFLEKADAMRRENYFKTTPGKKAIKLMLRDTLKSNIAG